MKKRDRVLDVLSEACRHRNVTHVIITSYVYDRYRSVISKDDNRKGFKYASIHGVQILTIDWMPDDARGVILAFNKDKPKVMQKLMTAIREEDEEKAADTLFDVLDKHYKSVVQTHLPEGDE